jgi:hypothetical protein
VLPTGGGMSTISLHICWHRWCLAKIEVSMIYSFQDINLYLSTMLYIPNYNRIYRWNFCIMLLKEIILEDIDIGISFLLLLQQIITNQAA